MKKVSAISALALAILTLASCAQSHIAFSPIPAVVPAPVAASLPPSLPASAGVQAAGVDAFPANPGFKTPEAALRYFAGCLERCDFPGAVLAFPVNELPRRFSYESHPERLRVIYMTAGFVPAGYREAGRSALVAHAARAYKSALGCFHVRADAVPADIGMAMVEKGSLFTAKKKAMHQENMASVAEMYGADTAMAFAVTLQAGGNTAVCDALILIRYDTGWFIVSGTFSSQR